MVLIAEHTERRLGPDHPPLEQRENIELKGKRDVVRLYAPHQRTSNGHTERATVP
jgi:class 3 adenylate cyclase